MKKSVKKMKKSEVHNLVWARKKSENEKEKNGKVSQATKNMKLMRKNKIITEDK